MNCTVCDTLLAQVLVDQGITMHPLCEDEQEQMLRKRSAELKEQLLEIIFWADEHSARSQQVAIGPSEIGQECDQRVARVLAGMSQVNNRFDPWAGIVGTSIHSWMQNAVDRYLTEQASPLRWKTEVRVHADDLISGSSDLYNGDVVDYKTTNTDKIKMMQQKGLEVIPEAYRVQGHIYGLGHLRAGRSVRDVVLVFMPRNGHIKDMFIWREPFDENIALAALDRLYRLADELIAADLPESGKWEAIELTPSSDCWYCPFYVDRPSDEGPDALGCPGNNKSAVERAAKAIDDFGKGLI